MTLFSTFRKFFIPHYENDYRPHILREASVFTIVFISVFLLGSAFGGSFLIHRTVIGAEISSSVLIDLTNESRLAYSQSPLVRSSRLDEAATLKGQDMANKEYFSHNSPDGVTPWYWFKRVGYNFIYAGENLAINFSNSADVEKAWLESPAHRANIMNVDFREIGIATVMGIYNGVPTIYIVQMFGTPASTKTSQSSKKIVASTPSNIIGGTKNNQTVQQNKSTSTVSTSSIQNIVSTQEMAIVKNNAAKESKTRYIFPSVSYSTWYEKILFNLSSYIDIIYKILLFFVSLALASLFLVEIKKHHYKHIIYGVSLFAILVLFIYLNQTIF